MPPMQSRQPPRSLAARWAALKNIPPFLGLVWRSSPALAIATILLRTLAALVPVITLWIAKLILDEVVRLAALPDAPGSFGGWINSGLAGHLGWLLAANSPLPSDPIS